MQAPTNAKRDREVLAVGGRVLTCEMFLSFVSSSQAGMAELADAADSKSAGA
jgi:hypothetical protein